MQDCPESFLNKHFLLSNYLVLLFLLQILVFLTLFYKFVNNEFLLYYYWIFYNFQKKKISRSKSNVTFPSSNWLFHAFFFPVAFLDLEIRVADFSSFGSPRVNFTFLSFLNFVFLSSIIWSVLLVFLYSEAFKLCISASVQYYGVVSVRLMFCCCSSFEPESYVVCCLSW